MLLSNQNSKLKKDKILSWSIPAYLTESGFKTCPGAKDCIKGCYARQGFHGMSWVKNKKESNFQETLKPDFVETMTAEILKRRPRFIRIHDAGDFYSIEYLINWIRIINRCPDVQFYAYTKMIPMFRDMPLPSNFKVIFSFGGRWDNQILDDDHHSKVFKTHEAMVSAGYADSTESDLVALTSKKVGLVYHGGKNLNWGTV